MPIVSPPSGSNARPRSPTPTRTSDQVATVAGGRDETYTYDKAGNRSMSGYDNTISYDRLSSGTGLAYI